MSPRPRARARPKPRLSQHFLRDPGVIERILHAVPDDGLPILEIGPGDGALSRSLAALGRPYVAVELDQGLAAFVGRALQDQPAAIVLNDDALDVDPQEALAAVAATPPYGIVANLPYAISSLFLRRYLGGLAAPPAWMLLMLQLEVAQQVVAPAGKRSLLSVSVQYYAEAELLFAVEREGFEPPPQVRSAVVFLRRRPAPAVEAPNDARFFEVVRAGFRAPRKQLHNTLSMGLWLQGGGARRWLEACGIDPERRPATLTLEEWAALARAREREGAPRPPELR